MRSTFLVALILLLTPLLAAAPTLASSTLTVGVGGFPTIQSAVNAAQPGDTILIMPGVYQEAVFVTKPGITLTGTDRDAVVLDGGLQLGDAITVVADNVTVKTLTAQNYVGNGVVFSNVKDFALLDLYAKDNGEYGLYVIHSQRGEIAYSYAEGHGDSGFYIGETDYCDCDVHHNVGWNNMLGYSGTANSYVRIWANEFYDNRAGILPNVLPQEFGFDDQTNRVYGFQVHTEIYGNYIHDNNNKDAPESGIWQTVHVPVGEGISIAGGWFNDIHDNVLTNNALWGVGLFWLTTPERGNQVHDNVISGSRYGIWWDEFGEDNCFENNDISNVQTVSDPAQLPSCEGPLQSLGIEECPAELGLQDFADCRGTDARAPGVVKLAGFGRRALLDLDPDQD